MGSISDKEYLDKIKDVALNFSAEYETRVLSAHRTPKELEEYIKYINEEADIKVVIAIAGKAAHLAGVISSLTNKPVIGLPAKTSMMGGMDSLLSIVQMPKGIPVATVGVGSSENSYLLAIRILALMDEKLNEEYKRYVEKMKKEVLEADKLIYG